MRNRRDDLETTAFHEAGHALAAVTFGCFNSSQVTIEPGPYSRGHCEIDTCGQAALLPAGVFPVEVELRMRAKFALVDLAGPAAQRRRRRTGWFEAIYDGGESDLKSALSLIGPLAPSGAAERIACEISSRFVRLSWPAIERVALELLKSRTLDREQIWDAMGEASPQYTDCEDILLKAWKLPPIVPGQLRSLPPLTP